MADWSITDLQRAERRNFLPFIVGGAIPRRRLDKSSYLMGVRVISDPVFAFLFVRVRDDELDQLDEILRADLTKYVRLA